MTNEEGRMTNDGGLRQHGAGRVMGPEDWWRESSFGFRHSAFFSPHPARLGDVAILAEDGAAGTGLQIVEDELAVMGVAEDAAVG